MNIRLVVLSWVCYGMWSATAGAVIPPSAGGVITYFLREQFDTLQRATEITSFNRDRLTQALNNIHTAFQESFSVLSSPWFQDAQALSDTVVVEFETQEGIYQELQQSILDRLAQVHQERPWVRTLISPPEISAAIHDAQERWQAGARPQDVVVRVLPYLFWPQEDVTEFFLRVLDRVLEEGECTSVQKIGGWVRRYGTLSPSQLDEWDARLQWCIQAHQRRGHRWDELGFTLRATVSTVCAYAQDSQDSLEARWCYRPENATILSEPLTYQGRVAVVIKDAVLKGFPSGQTSEIRNLFLIVMDAWTGNELHRQHIYGYYQRPNGGSHGRAPVEWPRPFGGVMPYRLHLQEDGIQLVTENALAVFTQDGELARLVNLDHADHWAVKYALAPQAFGHLVPRALELVLECQTVLAARPPEEPVDQRFALIENIGYAALDSLRGILLDSSIQKHVRERVASALKYFPTPEVIRALAQSLYDERVRDRSQWALAQAAGGDDVVEVVLPLLSDHTQPLPVRLSTLVVVQERFASEAELVLETILHDATEPMQLRLAVVEVFKGVSFENTVPIMLPLLQPDTPPALLEGVVQVLNQLVHLDPRSVEPLKRLLVPEVPSHIQDHVRLVLRRLENPQTACVPVPNTDAITVVAGDGAVVCDTAMISIAQK